MIMIRIHPTALVDKTVELGEGVTVGPYSIIEGRVTIGHDTHIGPHVVIRDCTTIGNKCEIFQFAVIGEIPQDLKFQGEESHLIIGDGNIIREFATAPRHGRGRRGHPGRPRQPVDGLHPRGP
jgi:UDP-N-acetylglucosamine acyltransferase